MFNKTILLLLCWASFTFAHKVAGVDMSLEALENDTIKVSAYFQKSKRALVGNEVRFISMFDNRVLDKAKLSRDGVIMSIPNESYWVYVIVRDNDIVQDGLAPSGGFKKAVEIKKRALLYSALASIACIILATAIAIYRRKKFQQSLL